MLGVLHLVVWLCIIFGQVYSETLRRSKHLLASFLDIKMGCSAEDIKSYLFEYTHETINFSANPKGDRHRSFNQQLHGKKQPKQIHMIHSLSGICNVLWRPL